jgi:hypothetical protein
MDHGAGGNGERQMRQDRPLRRDEAAIALKYRLVPRRQPIARKAPMRLGGIEKLMLQSMFPARRKRPLDDAAPLRPGIDRPGDEEQWLARQPLRLAPKFIGAAEQRHIGRMLEIGEADDPVQPMRRPHPMPDIKPLDPEHPQPPPRQLPAGSRAHAAEADDDDVVGLGHGGSLEFVRVIGPKGTSIFGRLRRGYATPPWR